MDTLLVRFLRLSFAHTESQAGHSVAGNVTGLWRGPSTNTRTHALRAPYDMEKIWRGLKPANTVKRDTGALIRQPVCEKRGVILQDWL